MIGFYDRQRAGGSLESGDSWRFLKPRMSFHQQSNFPKIGM
jgi:hypothetical protein